MRGTTVLLDSHAGREAAARVTDGRLEDLLIEPPASAGPGPEAILRGTVGRPVKGLGGVFVTLPDGMTGFLRQAKGLRPGQSLLVQIAGYAEPGKALPLTQRIILKGRTAILTPGAPGRNVSRSIRDAATRGQLSGLADALRLDETLGLILRSAAALAEPREIESEIGALSDLAARLMADTGGAPELLLDAPGPHDIALRDWAAPPPDALEEEAGAFARHGIDEMIDGLRTALVPLGAGASMFVEPTRALVAVDVNTGSDTSPAAGLKANLAAARDLPRQLRLRGLGGQVTVDFAPMSKKDRQVLEQTLKASFRRDGSETSLAGWTPLSHFELQRKRDRLPLQECLR